MCQQVETNQLFFRDAGDAGLEAIHEAHVVVTAHVGDHLRGFEGPGLFGVVHLRHVDLRMLDGSCNAELNALCFVLTTNPTCHRVVGEGTAQGVADLVAESCDAWHPVDMGFHGELLLGIGAAACTPAFTIDIDRGVDGIHHRTDLVHRPDVVDTHQVETETVDMVLVDPVFYALQHELTHHGLVRGSFVAAA